MNLLSSQKNTYSVVRSDIILTPHNPDGKTLMKFKKGNLPKNFKDLSGKYFGEIFVVSKNPNSTHGKARWDCKCSCGKELTITGSALQLGQTSCGCKRKTNAIHSMSETRTYKIWAGMIQRCTNKNIRAYKYYGERGIKVCDRWKDSFSNFLEDMGEADKGMSIERIDNNGDYCKENCKWIEMADQGKNKRNVLLINGSTSTEISQTNNIGYSTVRYRIKHGVPLDKPIGKEKFITKNGITLSHKDWAIKLGIAKSTISNRIKRGLSTDEVLKEFICST